MHLARTAIAALVLVGLSSTACTDKPASSPDVAAATPTGEAAVQPTPTADAAPAPTATQPDPRPELRAQVDARAKAVLERLISHYATFDGLSVVAKHRIKAPSRILHEQVRLLDIVKPNRFRVEADGRILTTSDGTHCWMLMPDKTGYGELKAPASLSEAMQTVPALGGGSIGGSGGIVAALLSPAPMEALLRYAARVEVKDMGTDDLLIIEMSEVPGTLRPGTRVGLFIPKNGPAWIAQADIIPPDVQVHTRIVFENWTPSSSPASAFELDPQALRIAPLSLRPTTPASQPESN